MNPPRATVVPWYREEDYLEIRKIMSDGSRFPNGFQKWLDRSNRAVDRLLREGHIIERVYIDPDTFSDWCGRNGLELDSHARQKFAVTVAADKYKSRS